MELIAKEVIALGGTIAEVRCFDKISCSPHLASFPTSRAAHFYWLGVYTEIILAAINMTGNAAAYLLTQGTHRLAAVIELAARDKVGDGRTALLQIRLKKPILAVYLLSLGSHAQCDDFKSEKRENVPQRRTFPSSVTKSSENCLHISKNLTNFFLYILFNI